MVTLFGDNNKYQYFTQVMQSPFLKLFCCLIFTSLNKTHLGDSRTFGKKKKASVHAICLLPVESFYLFRLKGLAFFPLLKVSFLA